MLKSSLIYLKQNGKICSLFYFYFLGRMGINFHHPGTDNIMALNSKFTFILQFHVTVVYSICSVFSAIREIYANKENMPFCI